MSKESIENITKSIHNICIMDNSTIICDEVIDIYAKLNDEAKSNNKTDFNQKKATCKT